VYEGEPRLAVWVDRSPRVGQGRGRHAYRRLLTLLRETGIPLGLLTNGKQFRLVYAGLDFDAWVEWEAADWFAETELRPRLQGFLTLLGPYGLLPRDGHAFPLLEAIELSRTRQGELSDVMGRQVRRAVERLVAELDRAARAHPNLLEPLRRPPEGDPLPEPEELRALYQAATRIVMRLVVVLFAEARGLLPRDREVYERSYGVAATPWTGPSPSLNTRASR